MITVDRVDQNKIQSGIYVGRGTPLGNPFPITVNNDREKVLRLYRAYLYSKIKQQDESVLRFFKYIKRQEAKNGNVTLLCHCHPLPCHAEIIIEAIEYCLANNIGDIQNDQI